MATNFNQAIDDSWESYTHFRDADHLDKVLEACTSTIRVRARRMNSNGAFLDDLLAEGKLGVLKATKRFESDRRVAFSTFMRPFAFGAMSHWIRDLSRTVAWPAHAQEKHSRARREGAELHEYQEIQVKSFEELPNAQEPGYSYEDTLIDYVMARKEAAVEPPVPIVARVARCCSKVRHILSKREREVLRLVVEGRNPEETAAIMFLSKRTVDFHTNNIHAKLHVGTRSEMIEMATTNPKLIAA
jgi:RNA polymerase sigma factor (sigma-70 family)